MSEVTDITPEGSVAPVFLDPTPIDPGEPPLLIDNTAERESALNKLMALGLTEAEARAIAGY